MQATGLPVLSTFYRKVASKASAAPDAVLCPAGSTAEQVKARFVAYGIVARFSMSIAKSKRRPRSAMLHTLLASVSVNVATP